ncbi:MAG: hypothetical protein L3K23_02880 [Thermoplasmata archaeon]|nr:hypothetical protein [Thermoplasmata archaeon]
MKDRPAATPDVAESSASGIDSFLLSYIRTHPGQGFGAIVQAAQGACHVSRTTAARHLSRLVRFGTILQLSEGSYVIGDRTAATANAIAEVRWSDYTVVVNPDGSARIFIAQEWRVVAGEVDHIDFFSPKPPRRFIWWSSSAARLTRIPATRAVTRQTTHRLTWNTPVTARDSAWQWYRICYDLRPTYRMAFTPRGPSTSTGDTNHPDNEFETVEVKSRTRPFLQRLVPEAQVRLHVILPEGYPFGRVQCHVRLLAESARFDEPEEKRLARLGKEPGHQFGLRRDGTSFTLSVPRPLVDRHYEIAWSLPTVAGYRRWLSALSRQWAR